jgi:hypothetical protein
MYGVQETNGLGTNGPAYHLAKFKNAHHWGSCDWTQPGLKITRLRLVSDPFLPFWDVSYCDGELDGKYIRVQLPFSQLPKRNYKHAIVQHAMRDCLYAKGTGILDNISTLC